MPFHTTLYIKHNKMNYNLHDLEPLPQAFHYNGMLLVAGPCSAESHAQVATTAQQLAVMGVGVFRAGLWKPRTHPGGFEGMGTIALPWLQQVKSETGMLIATEVANRQHVLHALQAGVDVMWIGARTTANPFAVQEIADVLQGNRQVSVIVKNPVSPDIELWLGALQRISHAGIRRLAAVHRGFVNAEEQVYRNTPMWRIPMELKRRCPTLPILVDPSHITGDRDMVPTLAQQALDMGFDGLMLEVHQCPDKALSDKQQQITPVQLEEMLKHLVIRSKNSDESQLTVLRQLIDECDDELLQVLARRMDVVRKIGDLKRKTNIQVVQPNRFTDILNRRTQQAPALQLDSDFVKHLLQLVHEEAVRQQL